MIRFAQPSRSLMLLTLLLLTAHQLGLAASYAQSDGAEGQRQQGLDLFRNGQFGLALEAYQTALDLDPANENLYLETTDIYLAARLPEGAEGMLSDAIRRFPDSTAPAYNLLFHDLAELWAVNGRLGKASEAMEAASRFDGPISGALIYKRIGDYSADLLRLDAALAAYQTALDLEPGNLATRLALGNLYLRRNGLDQALTAFREVLENSPGSFDALHGIGEVHRRHGEFEDALAAVDRVLERVPSHRNALYIRGTALVRLGRRQEGQQDLERYRILQAGAQAQEQRLRDINTFRTGGMNRVLDGQYAEAIALFEAGIQIYPDAAVLQVALGQAQGESGLHAAAIATFLSMLERGIGAGAVAHLNLVREYQAVGDIDSSDRHQALHEAAIAADGDR